MGQGVARGCSVRAWRGPGTGDAFSVQHEQGRVRMGVGPTLGQWCLGVCGNNGVKAPDEGADGHEYYGEIARYMGRAQR